MNSANEQSLKRSRDVPTIVRIAEELYGLDILNTTTTSPPPMAEVLRWTIAAYFVADATARKHFDEIFQQLRSLTEYELSKLASRSEADSAAGAK